MYSTVLIRESKTESHIDSNILFVINTKFYKTFLVISIYKLVIFFSLLEDTIIIFQVEGQNNV